MPRRLLLSVSPDAQRTFGIIGVRTAALGQRGAGYEAIRVSSDLRGVEGSRRQYSAASHDVSAARFLLIEGGCSSSRWQTRCFSTVSSSHDDDGKSPEGEKLRVAIVGAGAAGLSVGLHLSPLVSAGLLHTVDIYEANPENVVHPHCRESDSTSNRADVVDEHFHPGSGSTGRPIGVGIWSTALRPFAFSGRPSHAKLLKQLEHMGKYVGQVGYKTPEGKWLARSEIDEKGVDTTKDLSDVNPSLLFLKENDMLSALREAAKAEEALGNVHVRYGSENADTSSSSTKVVAIAPHNDGLSGRLIFKDGSSTDASTPYHLIISAEGISSTLRSEYAGHNLRSMTEVSTGVSALGGMKSEGRVTTEQREEWDEDAQAKVNTIEDRGYTVFRGNSPLTDVEAGMDGISFQTWGVGRSMRFAAVGMSNPSNGDRVEHQVWFATTNDHSIASVQDPIERRKLLADHFRSWHDPVSRLIESTTPRDIFVERGVAHKHSTRPVFDLANIIEHERRVKERAKAKERGHVYREPSASSDHGGPGPVLLFIGDSSMTVDPVLAQGFTIGMEAAADLARTLEACSGPNYAVDVPSVGGSSEENQIRTLLFDPDKLREELKARHYRRYGRMMALLRATELVQALAQPSGPFGGFLTRWLIRPAMRITPNFAKKPMFDFMLKYSLGLTAGGGNVVSKQRYR